VRSPGGARNEEPGTETSEGGGRRSEVRGKRGEGWSPCRGIIRVMSGAPADRIFFGGDVVTVDRDDRVVDAVAVRDGRIVAVGRRDDVMALRGPGTELTDLGGGSDGAEAGFGEP